MARTFDQILSFLVSSALECADDPTPYGSLRMMEAIQQMLDFVEAYGIHQGGTLREVSNRITAEKGLALADRARFRQLIEETAMTFVDLF